MAGLGYVVPTVTVRMSDSAEGLICLVPKRSIQVPARVICSAPATTTTGWSASVPLFRTLTDGLSSHT